MMNADVMERLREEHATTVELENALYSISPIKRDEVTSYGRRWRIEFFTDVKDSRTRASACVVQLHELTSTTHEREYAAEIKIYMPNHTALSTLDAHHRAYMLLMYFKSKNVVVQ